MDVRTSDKARYRIPLICLLLGFGFYLVFRPQVLGFNWHIDSGLVPWLPSWFIGSFPSFIFLPLITSTTLLCLPRTQAESKNRIIGTLIFWLVILIVCESLQGSSLGIFSRGRFDWLDLVAILLSTPLTLILLWPKAHKKEKSKGAINEVINEGAEEGNQWQDYSLFAVFLLGMASILGSSYDFCEGDDINALCVSPVILPWQEVRKEVQVELSSSQVLKRTGKIYTLDNWLFIVEKYRGIHIYDRSDKLNPIKHMYVPIPGALDLTIKEGVLYTSAFSDLVSLDFNLLLQSQGQQVSVVRQEDVFDYPGRYQFYPPDPQYFYSSLSEADPSIEGVVIGYKTLSGKVVLYGDEYDLSVEVQLKQEAKDDEAENIDPICFLFFKWMC